MPAIHSCWPRYCGVPPKCTSKHTVFQNLAAKSWKTALRVGWTGPSQQWMFHTELRLSWSAGFEAQYGAAFRFHSNFWGRARRLFGRSMNWDSSETLERLGSLSCFLDVINYQCTIVSIVQADVSLWRLDDSVQWHPAIRGSWPWQLLFFLMSYIPREIYPRYRQYLSLLLHVIVPESYFS